MKQIVIFTLLFSSICYSQSNSISEKASFKVLGVCEMCEERIEKETIKLKGVKYADWDILSNNISIIYNSKKIDLDKIHRHISLLGHSTEKYKAPQETYNSLPDCCRYETIDPH
ncbi:MAG: heavy-metal-associated domain-containing protein [Flavobacteriaceae bacterium]|nr:heavy-metal-associated domain-containing protein [Flavobacteriaceae bacterium]